MTHLAFPNEHAGTRLARNALLAEEILGEMAIGTATSKSNIRRCLVSRTRTLSASTVLADRVPVDG
jgi:hypothetical protein